MRGTFSEYGLEGEVAGRDGCVCFLNVTARYAPVRKLRIRVEGENKEPAEGTILSDILYPPS